MSGQVHIAGPPTYMRTVRRQRCSWCGALLDEVDLSLVARPLEPGEDPENPEPWEPALWEVGGLLRLTGTNPQVREAVEPATDDDGHPQAPDDSCLVLDVEVTR